MDKYKDLLSGQVSLSTEAGGDPRTDDTWLVVPWRALSAGVLHDRPLEFPENVLKEAVGLFNQAPVFPDHWDNVGGWLGKTAGAAWAKATAERPGGVDFEVWLDKTVTPKENAEAFRVVRGIDLGVLRCGSVDVRYEYDSSHPGLENWRYRLGEEVDGEMVRLVATRIVRIAEFSIVYAGSDLHATRLALEKTDNTEGKMSEQALKSSLSAVRDLLNLDSTAGDQVIKSAIEKLKTAGELKLTIGEGDGKKEITDKESILKLAMDGHAYREKLVQRAQAAYKLVRGDQVNQSYLKSIETMDTVSALAVAEEYEAQQDKLFPLKCAACGSTVTRRVSENDSGAGEESGGFDLDNV